MHALIYLRVSTDRQAEKGLSIPAQKERCLQYAKDHGYEIDVHTDIYIDEGESARTSNRPQFQVLWQRCRSDETIKAVIFYDISRLARNRIDFALIKQDLTKRGIQICSATEGIDSSPSGQMLEGVLSSVAEFFSLQNGEKVKGGMAQKAKDGWWPTRAPYGYKNVQERLSTGKVRSWIETNWEEAKWVIKAFELFATGLYSTGSLADKLIADGFPVRKNKKSSGKLHPSIVAKLLRDNIYIGVVEWGKIVNPNGKHELFLDRQLFDKVQAIMDARLGGGSRNRRLFSIIKSVAFCAECGSRATVEEHITSSGNVIRYLRCLKRQHNHTVPCKQEYGHEDKVLEELDSLVKLIRLPDSFVEKLRARTKTLFADQQIIYEKARSDLMGKLEATKARKKNLVLQLIDQKASASDMELYQSVKNDLDSEETRLNGELAKLENQIARVVRTVEIALALAADCHYAYQKAEPELKAVLVKTFFNKITIRDKKIAKAKLSEPLDYLCRKRLKKYPIFDLDTSGRRTRVRIASGEGSIHCARHSQGSHNIAQLSQKDIQRSVIVTRSRIG